MIELIILSALLALGVVLTLRAVIPSTTPRIGAAVARLTDTDPHQLEAPATTGRVDSLTARLGAWLEPRMSDLPRLQPPDSDLALLGINRRTVLGKKLLYAAVGLLIVPAYGLVLTATGTRLPLPLTGAVSLGIAAGMFLLPDLLIRNAATQERVEYTRTASTYLELIAIARISGADATSAITGPAQISEHPHLQHINRLLEQARFARQPLWAALQEEGRRIAVPAVTEVGDIVKLAEQDADIYETLRARATSMRDAQLAAERMLAKRQTQSLALPLVGAGTIFMIYLMYPAFVRLAGV